MLKWSILFLIVSVAAGAFGFGAAAGAAATIAKVLFGLFLLGFIITIGFAVFAANKVRNTLTRR
jgi:uncharacterized membrane protein YtjA (UPF0391 family)